MNDRDRLQQLRGLLARLERMPPSPDRDWMLAEVRARAVDVETGIAPAAVRALPTAETESAPCKPARVRAPRRPVVIAARPRPAVPIAPAPPERTGLKDAVDLLQPGALLCLDDPPGDAAARPWACGLRG